MTRTETLLTLMHGGKQLYLRAFAPLAEAFELSQLEIDLLLFLHNNPAFNTARSICELRGFQKSNVSTAVERLCRRGWLRRERDEANRRLIRLFLTQEAAPVVERAVSIQQRELEGLLAVFTPEERLVAEKITEKLKDRVAELLSQKEEG